MQSSIISLLALAASASAHMKMSNPKGWQVDNGPLDPSGNNFPCKGVNYNNPSETNVYTAGQSAPLTFIGQAVHGGGSCQVVLTKDLAPTASSSWKVIHSIMGGCPAKGVDGNMGSNAAAEDPFKYQFPIPAGLEDGEYTIAWTWFNKIGNREMYMNCGPATITGGSGSDSSFFEALPDMFVANTGNGCATVETQDLQFPNPGASVEIFGEPVVLNDEACPGISAQYAAGSSGSSDSDPSTDNDNGGANPAGGAEVVPSQTSGSNADGSLPGAVFATVNPDVQPTEASSTDSEENAGSEDAPPAAETSAATLPAADTVVDSPPASEIPSQSSEAGSSGLQAVGSACSPEGLWNCVDGSQFQRCGSLTWSVAMALAEGTSCSVGVADTLTVSRRGVPVRLPRRLSAKMFI